MPNATKDTSAPSADAAERRADAVLHAALAPDAGESADAALMLPRQPVAVERTDDGIVARFDSGPAAVRAALRLQRTLGSARVRIAVVPAGASPPGPPTMSHDRLLSVALPGQILMTKAIFDDARQVIDAHPVSADDDASPLRLRWMAHGPYLLGGPEGPVELCEVGAEGLAPLTPPDGNAAARRAAPPGADDVLGWRPGAGLEIPGRAEWRLDRRLGEGGFGEVWLARHRTSDAERVFKFCFDADRLRSFQREIALFRLLREALGERPDIAQLHDVHLDRPPYYLESAYSRSGSLVEWAEARGGVARVPLETRIDLVARIASAVAAAHSVGILHKDLKPSNVLIEAGADGTPRPRLADFGIGGLADQDELRRHHIMVDGYTETIGARTERSRTGTRLYTPPETLAGQPFTTQGDVYALGVLLYQLVCGDVTRPLGHGWETDVPDPLLRADIADCVAVRPGDRLAGALELARRLRSLPARRRAHRRHAARRTVTVGAVLLAAVSLVVTGLFLHERGMRRTIAEERDRAEQQARIADAVNTFLNEDLLAAANPENARGREITVREVLDLAAARAEGRVRDEPLVRASILDTLGTTYRELGRYDRAEPQLTAALRLRRAHLGDDAPATLASAHGLGQLFYEQSRYGDAEPLMVEAVDGRQRHFGPGDERTIASLTNVAALQARTNRIDEAITVQRRVLEDTIIAHGAESAQAADAMHNLAGFLKDKGDYADAERLYRETLDVRRHVLADDHPHTLVTMNALGTLLYELGRDAEAETLLVATLAARRRVLDDDHPATLRTVGTLGDVYRRRLEYDRAEPLLAETLRKRRDLLGPDHEATLDAMNRMASLYTDTGRTDDAEPLYREALAGRRRVLPEGHGAILTSLSNLGRLLTRTGRAAEAEPLFAEAVRGARSAYPPGHWFTAIYLQRSGECLTALARYDDAETALLEAHGVLVAQFGPDHVRTLGACRAVADLYEAWSRPDDAAAWRAGLPVADAQPTTTPGTPPGKTPAPPAEPPALVVVVADGTEQAEYPRLDLGRVPTSATAEGIVRVENRTADVISIADCRASCNCTTTVCPRSEPIAPGASIDVPVRMRSDVAPGENAKALTLIMGGHDPLRVLVRLEAYRLIDPTPEQIDPARAADGRVALRASDGRAFRVTGFDPEIADIPETAAADRQAIVLDWTRWRAAGRPRAVLVHTDHPECPRVQVSIVVPVPE